MKLAKSIKTKDTTNLFMNKYCYKIAIICPIANWLRGGDIDFAESKLNELSDTNRPPVWLKLRDPDDEKYCRKLIEMLKSFSGYEIRIEHPIINFYSNSKNEIEKLAGIDPSKIKYVVRPNPNNPELSKNTVIVKKLNYDYKIYLGKTTKPHDDFINWAENNSKIRLTGRTKDDLSRPRSWGGSYFYVKGEHTLTMVKMFIGSQISKIENIIKI
jgi:hypothetical protein